MSDIIPYDIDKQISYMDEILQDDALLSKIIPFEKIKNIDNNNKVHNSYLFSFQEFWNQVNELGLSLSLKLSEGHLYLIGSPHILLNDLKKVKKIKQPATVLTRKALPVQQDNNDNLSPFQDLNEIELFPVFAKGIFSLQGICENNSFSYNKVLSVVKNFSVKDLFESSKNEDILSVTSHSQVQQKNIEVVFSIDSHIHKYTLLKYVEDKNFHKECEEMRKKESPNFKIRINEGGTYLLSFYERIEDGPANLNTDENSNMIRHDYIFCLCDKCIQVAEFPYKKMIEY